MPNLSDMILSYPWLVAVAAVVGLAFVGAFLWKIMRSQEGFLFGYGNWTIGKWHIGNNAETPPAAQPAATPLIPPLSAPLSQVTIVQAAPAPAPVAPPPGAQAPAVPNKEAAMLRRTQELQSSVLTLSKALDADFAYLMMHDAAEWQSKIVRAMQTLCSGVTRVVHPSGRCRCGFFILDQIDENFLEMVAGEGYGDLQRTRLALEHSCAGRAFETGEEYYCRDIVSDPVYWQSAHGSKAYRSIACMPVRAGRSVFGVLCLDGEQPNAFTPQDFAHLEVFAAKLAVFCAFLALQAGLSNVRQ